MEDKRLNRVFDRVKLSPEREDAILADLLNEKREVSSMKQKRRIPAAALVAAALVVVLTGTALAAGYFGRVTIVPQDQSEDGGTGRDYEVYGDCDGIPAESLSKEVLALSAEADPSGAGLVERDFASLSECEAFLGLELADNPILEQPDHTLYIDGMPADSSVYAFFYQRLLSSIRVDSFYEVDGYRVNQYALLRTEESSNMYDHDILMTPGDEEVAIEEYVTPHDMEVSIFTETADRGGHVYWSFFTRDNVLYALSLFNENGQNESEDMALIILKEVLDAYE